MRFIILLFTVLLQLSNPDKDYPVPPKTRELLFYIQRNHNSNTIVYDANFDKDGILIENKPVDVYWLRYEEDGRRMELRAIEKKFAYGVEIKKIKNMDGYFQLKLVADKKKLFWLKQLEPNKAVVYTKINGKTSELEHLYIFADNSGIWPDVKYIELFGKETATGQKTYEKVINN